MFLTRNVQKLTNADGFRRWRGRMGEWFEITPLREWMEIQTMPKNESRQAVWALYDLTARVDAGEVASVQEQIDRLEHRLRLMREEYRDQFPGAQHRWEKISAADHELRELRDQLKKIKTLAQQARGKPGKI